MFDYEYIHITTNLENMNLISANDHVDQFLTRNQKIHSSWEPVRNRVFAVLLLIVTVMGSYFVSIDRNQGTMSPIDEWSFVDSVFQASHLGLVHPGEDVSLEGKNYLACQDIWGVDRLGAGCGAESQPSDAWPLNGKSPAEIHPPFYFLGSAIISKVFAAIGIKFDLIDGARLAGGFWILAGFLIWLSVYRRLGADLTSSTSLLILVALSPLVISTNTFISPDATFAISSGLVVLVSIKVLREEISPVWLLLAGAIPVLFKVSHLLTSIQLAALFLTLGFVTKSITKRFAIRGAISLMAGTVLGLISWQIARGLLRVGASPVHPEEAPAITLRNFVANFGYHFSVLPQSSTSPIPVPWLSVQSASLFSFLLLGASIGGFIYFKNRSEYFAVSLVAASSVYLGAVALSFITFVIAGGFLVPTARYGLPLLLLWTIPLVIACSRTLGHWILAPLALVAIYAVNFGGY